MDTKKITPWINWEEWKAVVDDAYNKNDDIAAYKRALTSIIAWQAREQNLPSGILCLKELIVARLAKLKMPQDSIDSIVSYQSCVAMHVVRFVNFITEPYQTNIHAKTIKNIASTIGIPDWIVNIRHSATHFTLPSIEILEQAIEYLFDYLQKRYVNTYKEISLEQSVGRNVKAFIHSVFSDYMNAHYQITQMRLKKKSSDIVLSELDDKVEAVTVNFRNETFEILLEDGYMIPTNEQLNGLGIVGEEFMEQENLMIPKQIMMIWNKFLTFCNDNNLIEFFFSQLISAYKFETENKLLSTNENLRNKFLLSWIIHLLKFNSYKNSKLKMSKFYFHFTYNQVLLDILSNNPNHFTFLFLKEISKIASFANEVDSKSFEKLNNLVNFLNMSNEILADEKLDIKENNCDEMELDENYSFYDLTPFENALNQSKITTKNFFANLQKNLVNSNGTVSWKLIDDINWNYDNNKLGFLDNQNYLNLNLNIDQFNVNANLDTSLNQSFQSSPKFNTLSEESQRFSVTDMNKKLINNYWETA